jgi:hypothetical protein
MICLQGVRKTMRNLKNHYDATFDDDCGDDNDDRPT